jgi:hypothetical protein
MVCFNERNTFYSRQIYYFFLNISFRNCKNFFIFFSKIGKYNPSIKSDI